jgi:hypothetical protein
LVILGILALAKFFLHLLTNGQYGYHADELYYMAAGDHLAWGYTEFPPMMAVVIRLSRELFGDSLSAIRLFPALAGAAVVLLTGLITRELGGGHWAQGLAALSVIVAPYYLFMQTIATMNAFEPLFWVLTAYLIIVIIKYHRPRLWIGVGLVVGLGILNKYSTVFFGFSLLVGLVITRTCRGRGYGWLGLAITIAAGLSLPNVLWQYHHGWPFLEHQAAANLYDKKPLLQSTINLVLQPVLYMHPLTFPLWVGGLYFYFQTKAGTPYRFIGWSYGVLFGLFVLLKAKYYYLAPIYPLLLAPGAILVEHWAKHRRPFRIGIVLLLLVSTLPMVPMVLPVLPLPSLLRFSQPYTPVYTLPNDVSPDFSTVEAPRHYRLMLGWEELVAQVSRTYYQLPPTERAKTAILAWDYGAAGAINFFGPNYGLPQVISGAHTFYFWGPRGYTGDWVLSVGGPIEELHALFDQVEALKPITYRTSPGIQGTIPLYWCQRIKTPWPAGWPRFKAYFGRSYPP